MYSVQVFLKLSFSYSGPTYLMVLSREDAVQGWRQMIGPTDPEKAKEENPESYVDMNYLPWKETFCIIAKINSAFKVFIIMKILKHLLFQSCQPLLF